MNPRRDGLSEVLRELSAASPEASAGLQSKLGEAFVHHHAQRRIRQRVTVLFALVVCASISAYWLRPHPQVVRTKVVEPATQNVQAPLPAPQVMAPESPKLPAPSIARAGGKLRVQERHEPKPRAHEVERTPATVETADFVALPSFDPAVPLGASRMVRMDLPGSALQQIGYPVDGQLLDRRIVTDVLVGQDGMPYAVRLVNTRNVH